MANYEHAGNGRRYFDSIPDDVILTILNKIGEVESLFNFQFSCRRFAHLVFLVTGSISVHISSMQIPSLMILVGPFFPVWPPGKLKFIGSFNQVDSVTIRFSRGNGEPQQMPVGHLYRWKSESAGFIMLHAKQRRLASSDDAMNICNVLSIQELSPEELMSHYDMETIPLSDSDLRVRYIKDLVGVLPNLNRVSAVDFVKQGRVVVDEEGVANMRNALPLEDANLLAVEFKLWVAPEVKLPFSGFVLSGVTLICYRFVEADHIDIFEENEYSEVAARIMQEEPTLNEVQEMRKFNFVDI